MRNPKVRWITETAVMLALLICLQWVGSRIPNQMAKQLVTGTCVNCILAVTVLFVGMGSGLTIALISPVCAFLFHIAPNIITVVPIMLGNSCYVVLLRLLSGKTMEPVWRQPVALVAAALTKFAVLYALVVGIVCGVASDALLDKTLGKYALLKAPMLNMLPTMFSWPQLVTALTGGVIALAILPVLKKALKR